MQSLPSALLATVLISISAVAETVKDRAGAVRGDRAAYESDLRWNYNDAQRGFNEARRTGKPLLVVLRCVPCMACAGMDAAVLNEPELKPLLDQFVCVRVINANALDLSLLQFDYDLSLSTLFFNADGTVYGRYGSWTHQKNPLEKSTAGYKRALEEALKLHKAYPGNKAALAGKQPGPIPFKDPLEIPGLAGKYSRQLDWDNKVVQSCVHCHQIGDAIRAHYRSRKEPIPQQWIYPLPTTETIGLTLAPEHTARIAKVSPNSPAGAAGLKAKDDIESVDETPILSITDVSWMLHRAPDSATLAFRVRRDGVAKTLQVNLPAGWRAESDISRRVGTWPLRAMAFGGLVLEDIRNEERHSRGLAEDGMALLIKHAGEYNEHAAAKKAGFRKDDVIVELDGSQQRTSESKLIGQLLAKHQPGEKVSATVLRGTERLKLSLPIQ